MRNRPQLLAVVALSGLSLLGCRQDMHDQPKYKPQRPSDFFADGRSGRPPVDNVVARGTLYEDTAFYTGKENGKDVEFFPLTVDKALIERGHQRFNIYCSVCHGKIGNGLGMIVRRGFKMPPSYHIERLRNAPVGHFFDVITNGYGTMWNYAAQISPRDRWAIISYVRALQYSQNANINDLSSEMRSKLASLDKHPPIPNGPAQPLVPNNPANDPRNNPMPATAPGQGNIGNTKAAQSKAAAKKTSSQPLETRQPDRQ